MREPPDDAETLTTAAVRLPADFNGAIRSRAQQDARDPDGGVDVPFVGGALPAPLWRRAGRPALRFLAVGAAFSEPKDSLKGRGYRWRPGARVWAREVAIVSGEEERAWRKENVYADRWRSWAAGPRVEDVDWSNRHVG